jgi:hypothetical protein
LLGVRIAMARSDNTGHTGNGTDTMLIAAPRFQLDSSDSTYLATTTFPQYAGLNNNQAFVYDGSNDSLATNLAVNPTGGMAGIAVIRSNGNFAAQTQQIASALLSGSATTRLETYLTAQAGFRVNIHNAAPYTSYIGRVSADNAIVANQVCVLSWTYDGSINATGIKLYKNGVQIDTTSVSAGTYAVPTAGANLVLGNTANAALGFNGYILDQIFVQGRTMSDAERQNYEQRFMQKYNIS